jgi:hypothetical protein
MADTRPSGAVVNSTVDPSSGSGPPTNLNVLASHGVSANRTRRALHDRQPVAVGDDVGRRRSVRALGGQK